MANAKIDFTIGGISFSGEGEESWLANQLDKIIEKAADLIKIAPSPQVITEGAGTTTAHEVAKADSAIAAQPLSSFLRDKNATRVQIRKFLATALWLQEKGKERMLTGDIIRALKDSNQTRLGNASRELASNISSGVIDRDGRQFFVTEQGKASL
ncbi:hypothetical protein ACFLWI_01270 [Chloroflexota bacterium]